MYYSSYFAGGLRQEKERKGIKSIQGTERHKKHPGKGIKKASRKGGCFSGMLNYELFVFAGGL